MTNKNEVNDFLEDAENGNREAQFGMGVLSDGEESASWYIKAKKQLCGKSANNLAIMYFYGVEIHKDIKEARDMLHHAAHNLKDVRAMKNLRKLGDHRPNATMVEQEACMSWSLPTKKDLELHGDYMFSVDRLAESSYLGYTEADLALYHILDDLKMNNICGIDSNTTKHFLVKAAKDGNPEACYIIGQKNATNKGKFSIRETVMYLRSGAKHDSWYGRECVKFLKRIMCSEFGFDKADINI